MRPRAGDENRATATLHLRHPHQMNHVMGLPVPKLLSASSLLLAVRRSGRGAGVTRRMCGKKA